MKCLHTHTHTHTNTHMHTFIKALACMHTHTLSHRPTRPHPHKSNRTTTQITNGHVSQPISPASIWINKLPRFFGLWEDGEVKGCVTRRDNAIFNQWRANQAGLPFEVQLTLQVLQQSKTKNDLQICRWALHVLPLPQLRQHAAIFANGRQAITATGGRKTAGLLSLMLMLAYTLPAECVHHDKLKFRQFNHKTVCSKVWQQEKNYKEYNGTLLSYPPQKASKKWSQKQWWIHLHGNTKGKSNDGFIYMEIWKVKAMMGSFTWKYER